MPEVALITGGAGGVGLATAKIVGSAKSWRPRKPPDSDVSAKGPSGRTDRAGIARHTPLA